MKNVKNGSSEFFEFTYAVELKAFYILYFSLIEF